MFTKYTATLLGTAFNAGSCMCGVPVHWNTAIARLELSPLASRSSKIRRWCSWLLNLAYISLALCSYVSHVREHGARITTVLGLWQALNLAMAATSVMFVVTLHTRTEDIPSIVNTLLGIYSKHERKRFQQLDKDKEAGLSICDVQIAAAMLAQGALVPLVSFLYLTSCDLHLLRTVDPDLFCNCPEYESSQPAGAAAVTAVK